MATITFYLDLMGPGKQLLCALIGAVVIFRGVLSLLPDDLAREYDGSLTGLGFWIPMMATLFAGAWLHDFIKTKPTPDE